MADRDGQNILSGYISKIFINTNTSNDDIVTVKTKNFSSTGDVFELERRALSPRIILTEKNLQELEPEVSDEYPYKIVSPEDAQGKVILYSPTVDSEVTASQNYYTPVYFERYNLDILRGIDKEFTELSVENNNFDDE